ncbi:hypothetical protein E2320_002984, partial [Naja naja]
MECWAFEKNRQYYFLDHLNTHCHKLLTTLNPPMALASWVQDLLDFQALHVETSSLNVTPVIALYHTFFPHAYADLVPHTYYELKDMHNGFLLEGSTCFFLVSQNLTTCSYSVSMVHQFPCQYIFAARLWVAEALFDLNLLSSSSNRNQDI